MVFGVLCGARFLEFWRLSLGLLISGRSVWVFGDCRIGSLKGLGCSGFR